METFGPLYVGSIRYYKNKGLPIFEIGTTQESEHPYRKGKCLIYRNPGSATGRYLGVWVKNPRLSPDDDDEINNLLSAALSQYVNPDKKDRWAATYRVNLMTPEIPKHVWFWVTGDTHVHPLYTDAYPWEYSGSTEEPWKQFYVSRCAEHSLPALLDIDGQPCYGWHLETKIDGEYEPVL